MVYTKAQKAAYAKRMAAFRSRALISVAPGIFTGKGGYTQRFQRSVRQARGYGRYKIPPGTGQKVGTAVGAGIGAAFGNPAVGASLGGMAGDALQALLKAVGIGDYKVEHNVLLQGGGPPILSNSSSGVIVRHREYLQNIVTADDSSFNLQSFAINPGVVSSFPWLSQVASAYEQYKIRGMIWEFKSTSADSLSSTVTALGSVIMATEYDSSRANFANQQQMANHEFANSCKQSCSMLHAIECKKSLTPVSELWVRTGSVPTGDDERLYDWGNFQIATVGGPAVANTIGELWVTYEVEFMKPQLITGLGLELLSDHFTATTAVTTSAYFGTDTIRQPGSNLGCTLASAGGGVYFPPGLSEGTFMLLLVYYGASTAVNQPAFTPTNCTELQIFKGSSEQLMSSNGSTVTVYPIVGIYKINKQSAQVIISGGTIPGTITNMDLWITQINGGIST